MSVGENMHTPGPWKWRDRYDFREHLEHREQGLEADCHNIREGRIELVGPNGAIVLVEWADHADDGGLSVTKEDASLIATAPAGLALARMADECALQQCDHADPWQCLGALRTAARALIADAEGK